MIKRGSVEDGGQERSNILDEVEKLIFNGDLKKVKFKVFYNYQVHESLQNKFIFVIMLVYNKIFIANQ